MQIALGVARAAVKKLAVEKKMLMLLSPRQLSQQRRCAQQWCVEENWTLMGGDVAVAGCFSAISVIPLGVADPLQFVAVVAAAAAAVVD